MLMKISLLCHVHVFSTGCVRLCETEGIPLLSLTLFSSGRFWSASPGLYLLNSRDMLGLALDMQGEDSVKSYTAEPNYWHCSHSLPVTHLFR